ncbi:MAG TPA: hypothetical protein VF169_28135 [Albitalea sp.]|uniref:hypothetical protein n=1 Tax=Piscinibacter sp. TaxID=1903157 RepID=UPI002ED253A0
MFNRNKKSGALVPALLALLLLSALAVAADDARNPLDNAPRAAAPAEPLYLVRCWQYGRLLFEERDLALPPDVVSGLKLRGTDRNRAPVFVADTGSSTCLIRSTPPARR